MFVVQTYFCLEALSFKTISERKYRLEKETALFFLQLKKSTNNKSREIIKEENKVCLKRAELEKYKGVVLLWMCNRSVTCQRKEFLSGLVGCPGCTLPLAQSQLR